MATIEWLGACAMSVAASGRRALGGGVGEVDDANLEEAVLAGLHSRVAVLFRAKRLNRVDSRSPGSRHQRRQDR